MFVFGERIRRKGVRAKCFPCTVQTSTETEFLTVSNGSGVSTDSFESVQHLMNAIVENETSRAFWGIYPISELHSTFPPESLVPQ